MIFIGVAQTWYGREKIVLRSYHVNDVLTTTVQSCCKGKDTFSTSLPYPPRPVYVSATQRYGHITLYKTILRMLYVRSVLLTSAVRLQQVLVASMSCPLNQYKIHHRISYIFTCVSTFIMRKQNQDVLL